MCLQYYWIRAPCKSIEQNTVKYKPNFFVCNKTKKNER